MLRVIANRVAVAVLPFVLMGCDSDRVFTFTPEDRINIAFPVSETVRNGKAALIELAPEAQRKDINSQYNTRLKLRALGCAKSYSPAWLTSTEDIRKNVGDPACFTDTDDEIARWLSLRRVGLILAQPALKAVPAKAPAFILADESIQNVAFAEKAGVALIETSQAIELVDFESAKPLFREAKSSGRFGVLSPNGRLFTSGDGERLKIRDAMSGAVLAELKSVRPHDFHWLDERTAFYARSDSAKAVLIDLPSGKEIPLLMVGNGVQRVVRVPQAPNQFVMFSWRTVSKIEVVRDKPEPEIKLLAEKPLTGISWTLNTSGATADGSQYFSAIKQLSLVSLASLEVETVPFEPFYIQSGMPTPDADKLLITGFTQPPQGEGQRDLIYSIGNRTLMAVDRAKLTSQRYLYIPSLRKQAVISENKIAVLDELPTTETFTLAKFTSDALEVANQRKLEAFERQQQAMQADYDLQSRMQGARDSVMGASRRATPAGTASVLANLARDAQIEAVGVYQGSRGGGVEVRVRRSARPIVLVLCSYESVQWTLIPEPGARIAAVLFSGSERAQVVGAAGARLVMMGSAYAYKQGTPQFNILNQDVMRTIGKPIDVFQGRYEGSAFSVGG